MTNNKELTSTHFDNQKMGNINNKQQSSVEWLLNAIETKNGVEFSSYYTEFIEQAKEMEKKQRGYTKEDVLKAGEMGEINHYDTKHIVKCLDEAKEFNETYGGGEQ